MLTSPDTPPSSSKTGATIAGIIAVILIAAGGVAFWRPALFGLGGGAPLENSNKAAPRVTPGAAVTDSDTPDKNQVAVFETPAGRIVIEFLPEYAPKHTVAFQNMFRSGFFDGTLFHRTVTKRLIQGGCPNTKDDNPYDDGLGHESQRRIPGEVSAKIRHGRGTVSAARQPRDPDSATSQFFICTREARDLDGQFTIFARVIDGMDVVDAIANAPQRTDDTRLRERPADPVRITKAYLTARETAMRKGSAP